MFKTFDIRSATALAAIMLTATAASAQEHRELDAHIHGVSTLEVALEHGTLTMDLHSPGMDIAGFEHAASSAGDKDAVAEAIRILARPEDLFVLPEAAGCRLSEVLAHLHDGEHEPEREETDAHAAHEEDEHHAAGEDHDGEEHEGEEHEGEAHEGEQRHSEFHARYAFECDSPDDLKTVDLKFFTVFGNAAEIEAAVVTETGASKQEIEPGNAVLTLR